MRIDTLTRYLGKITEYSFYVFIAFYPVSKAMIEICFTVALISWLLRKFIQKEPLLISWKWPLYLLLLYVIFSAASCIWSLYPDESFRGMFKMLKKALFFLIVADSFQSREKIKRLFTVGVCTFFVILLDSLYQFTGKDLLRGLPYVFVDGKIRLMGPFKDHTNFAGYIMTWMLFLISFLTHPLKFNKKTILFLGLCLLPLGSVCLFYSKVRGAWVSFLVALSFFILLRNKKKMLIILGVFCVAGLFLLPRNLLIHSDADRKEQSLRERFVLWERALNVIEARPLFGTGLNTYVRSYKQFDKQNSWRVQNYYAHNSYLQITAESGIPAICFLLLLIGSLYWKGIRVLGTTKDPEARAAVCGLLAVLTGYLTYALVDTIFESLQSGMHVWYLMGLLLAVFLVIERQEKGKTV